MLKDNLFLKGRYGISGWGRLFEGFDASVDYDKERKPIIVNIIARWR
jgi:hypothetical protein